MGIYRRGDRLWFRFKDASGQWISKPSPFRVGQEAAAKEAFARATDVAKEGSDLVDTLGGEVTVSAYAKKWLEARERRGVAHARTERLHLVNHVGPLLGKMKIVEVRSRHVAEMVRALRKNVRSPKGTAESSGAKPVTELLSNRYVRHIYGTLHAMFRDAVADGLTLANPCSLRKGELPPKKDKDPRFRRAAVFSPAELEQLISDERIPVDRRVIYGLLFLTGMRPGELIALQWRDYEKAEPLHRFWVTKAWSRELRVVKSTKTETDREIPVHPTLAKLLTTWRATWSSYFADVPGMTPTPRPDDPVVPSREGKLRSPHHIYERFLDDLKRIGLRQRRLYDSRRTFTSLAIGGGAPKDVLRWVTHGVRRDILDEYTTVPWPDLCAAVKRVKAELITGKVIALRAAERAEQGESTPLPSEDPKSPHAGRKWKTAASSDPAAKSRKSLERPKSLVTLLVTVEDPHLRFVSGIGNLSSKKKVGPAGLERLITRGSTPVPVGRATRFRGLRWTP